MRLFFIWPWVTSARANMYGLKINRIPQIGYTFIQMRLTWVSYCTYVSQWCILKWNIERWKTSQFCFLLFPPLCYGLEVNSENAFWVRHFMFPSMSLRPKSLAIIFWTCRIIAFFVFYHFFFLKQICTTSASLQRQRVVYQRPFVCCCASLLIVVAKLPRQKWMTER